MTSSIPSLLSSSLREVGVDLSEFICVTTANSLNLPQALLDRMEIIRLEGYTEDEKVEIAKLHLIAKQVEAHGLKAGEFELTEERSEEHTSELQSLMRISYAVFCLKKKKNNN